MKHILSILFVLIGLHAVACDQPVAEEENSSKENTSHLIAMLADENETDGTKSSTNCADAIEQPKPVLQTKTYDFLGLYQLKIQYYELDCKSETQNMDLVNGNENKELAKKKSASTPIGGGFIFDVI